MIGKWGWFWIRIASYWVVLMILGFVTNLSDERGGILLTTLIFVDLMWTWRSKNKKKK